MARFRVPEVAIGFLVASAFWVAVAIIYPKYYSGEQEAAQNPAPVFVPKPANEAESETNRRIADYNRALDWLTLGLVVANIALWWVTWRSGKRQLSISAQQTDIQRKQHALEQLQYFTSHRPRIILRDVHWEKGQVFYILTNVGGTKATIIEAWIMVEFLPDGRALRPLRSFGHDDLGRLVFEAGEMKDLTYVIPGVTGMSADDMMRVGIEEGLISGQGYFTGTIVYEDDVGIKRRAVFRRRWNVEGKSFARLDPAQERDNEYSD